MISFLSVFFLGQFESFGGLFSPLHNNGYRQTFFSPTARRRRWELAYPLGHCLECIY